MAVQTHKPDIQDLVAPTRAAQILKTTPETLAVWRCTGRYNLPYYKIGRSVRYSLSDLKNWLESNKIAVEVA